MAKRNWYDRVNSDFVQNVANIYLQESGIPAFDIFPELPSQKINGKIALYNKEDWYYIGTVADYIRSGAVESVGDDYETSSQDYTLLKYSFHKDVTEDEANEYDNPFEPVEDAVKFVVNRIRRVITQKLVNSYLATGVWGSDLVGATDFTKWSDAAADPIGDVLQWQESVHKVTGFRPNKLIVTPDIHRVLKVSSSVTDRMKTTDDKVVTKDLMAKLFEVDRYVVIDTINSSATDYMASNKLLLAYTPERPSRMTPSAGYTLVYRNERLQAATTTRIPMEVKNHALRVEADVRACPLALASDLGVFATDVV